MGFFGKNILDETVSEKNDKSTLDEEMESKIDDLEKVYNSKQDKINEITQKIQLVREEYDETVRDATGNIVQFKYGEDGIDVSKSEESRINIKRIIDSLD